MRALAGSAWIVHQQRDLALAESLADEGLVLARQFDDRWTIAWLLHVRGRIQYFRNDAAGARGLAEKSLRVAQEQGDPWLIAWARHLSGLAAHIGGDFATARSYYTQSLAIRREIGNYDGIGTVLGLMAMAAYSLGDYAQSRMEFEECLTVTRRVGHGWILANNLAGVAALAAAQGQPERAMRLASAALALSDIVGVIPIPLAQGLLEQAVERARPALSAEAYAAAWAEGAALSEAGAAAEALQFEVGIPPSSQDGRRGEQHVEALGGLAHPLSAREVEVLQLIVAGRTTKEIASHLIVSVPTVERHITHIYAKIGARRRADATAYAVTHGLAAPGA
jgi:non-specific serine/threonine protein kinase